MNDSLDEGIKLNRKLAVLIDGDNAQPKIIDQIITESGKYGLPTIKRVYGDWTTPQMQIWKEHLHTHAIQPIQQFRYTTGKNSTDSALIIDAMDILHKRLVEGFSIISSDSDFTRLATRIREEGFFVMGIGEKKTPKAFVKACDIFVYTENISPQKMLDLESDSDTTEKQDPIPLLVKAYEMVAQEDEWVNLAPLGITLQKLDPGFDPRTYGYKRLSQIIKNYPNKFEIKFEQKDGGSIAYIKLIE
jgi:uncharacterized LabA/DUF88 family protein